MQAALASQLSIRGTAAMLRSGELKARQVMEQTLAAQDALADRLNVFASRSNRDSLLELADVVDGCLARGDVLPPLAGIPVAVKDIYCTVDLPTTASSRLLRNY